jgi:vacuolar-type H+-ATPase subunit E/Vma4
MREEARTLAATVRREGNERADALLERATNPAARMAAQVGADRIRREADEQAERLVREADARADGQVMQVRRQADALVPAGA